MAKITIFVPDQEPFKLSLDGAEQVTVGRSPDSDIVLDHASISGNHAVINVVEGQHQLTDLGSTNGTFIEGAAVTETVALVSGTKIQFGEVEADFEDENAIASGAEEAAPAEAAEPAAEEFAANSAMEDSGWEPAANSARPNGFKDLSPIEKVEKKDSLAQIAILIGVLGVIAVLALVVMTAMMKIA